jgi:hypothetical protein
MKYEVGAHRTAVPRRASSKFKVQDSKLADAGFFSHELNTNFLLTRICGQLCRPYS